MINRIQLEVLRYYFALEKNNFASAIYVPRSFGLYRKSTVDPGITSEDLENH